MIMVYLALPTIKTALPAGSRQASGTWGQALHHVHILEMNADSYRLKQGPSRRQPPSE